MKNRRVNKTNRQDRNLFFYWEGEVPSLISVLRELIYQWSDGGKNYEPILLNDSNIKDYVDLPVNYDRLSYVHKADFIRAAVINKFGGIYIDSDTLVMSSLNELFKFVDNDGGFFSSMFKGWCPTGRPAHGWICGAVFGSQKGTDFMKRWEYIARMKIENMDELWPGPEGIPWESLCNVPINREIDSKFLVNHYKLFNGEQSIFPVWWTDANKEFIDSPESNIHNIEKPFQPLVILVNSVYNALRDKTEQEIIEMRNPLGSLLRKAIRYGGH